MAFTYDPTLVDDVSKVRFEIADTVEDTAYLSDAEITAQISMKGSWQGAVIPCIEFIIAKLSSDPDFKADWLEVKKAEAIKGWKLLIEQKQGSLGTTRMNVSAKAVYRPDSFQTDSDW